MGRSLVMPQPKQKILLRRLWFCLIYARRGGQDDHLYGIAANISRSCTYHAVVFRTVYTISNFAQRFCTIFVGTTNIGNKVVTHGWAKLQSNYKLRRLKER
uniref:Putative nuclease (SNase-like), OB-fold protein n=1 Tax=Helianthus annuus TaxID=4232 RepID=A0A251TC72_HELAN